MASPRMLALLGLLAVAGYQNRDKLGDMIGRMTGGNGAMPGGAGSGSSVPSNRADTGLGGILGGLFGGGMGGSAMGTGGMGGNGGISGALGDLLDHFNTRGAGDAAHSWVTAGPNRPVAPDDLQQALGEDTIAELTQKTGLSRQELLSRLSTVLPQAVDKLTPAGRLPTRDEEARWGTAA